MVWVHPRDRRRKKKPPLFTDKHWQDCYASWLAHVRARNSVSTTPTTYESPVRRFFSSDPNKTPDRYSRQDVERFLQAPNARTGEKTSDSCYNLKLTALSSFYSYALIYEYSFRGGSKRIYTGIPPTHDMAQLVIGHSSRAMSNDELDRFFAAIAKQKIALHRKRDRALFLAYLWSGRRCSEIARLRWRDIEIVTFYNEESGATHEGWLYRWRGKGHRTIDDAAEMPAAAVAAIKEYLEADGRWGRMTPSDPLFPGRYPTETMSAGNVNYLFQRYAKEAGIDRTGTHRLRHTAATRRHRKTRDLADTQRFLRHSNPMTTLRYIQPNLGDADKVAPLLLAEFGHL